MTEYREEIIYPFCYRITDECPKVDIPFQCLYLLADYVNALENTIVTNINETKQKLCECLKNYGDLYEKIDMELYVNPQTNQILFPEQERIQSSFNVFLRDIVSKRIGSSASHNLKFKLFNLLLNSKFREIYNNLYLECKLASIKSKSPKEYGIARLLGKGGKKKRKTTKRRTNVN